MKLNNVFPGLAAGFFLAVTPSFFAPLAHGQSLEVLHSFQGSDGRNPWAPLVQGGNGNFYGTTDQGGANGVGTVFELTIDGALTTLISFNGSNGRFPRAGLVQGSDGNFYGTTALGGNLSLNNGNGYGTVFKMTPSGELTTLVRFNNSNGAAPSGELVEGSDGNFYGTCFGVNAFAFGGSNYGTIFRITPDGTLTTLVRFSGGNAAYPSAGLVEGSDGNFYGTTGGAGSNGGENGRGMIFKVTPNGVLTALAAFNGSNGAYAHGLVQEPGGNFYGTTAGGGAFGGGTAFKLTPDGVLTALFSFDIPPNQYSPGPWAGLLLASDGNFYGTTHGGNDAGTVFRMTPGGALTTIASFDRANGMSPEAGLVQGQDGNLYGTTYWGGDPSLNGGNGMGAVFRIVMPPALPRLDIAQHGNQIVLSWPASADGFVLESEDSLTPPTTWTPVSEIPTITGGQNTIAVSDPRGRKFYRLRKP